jgi:NTP pyrophosphatase (non-canonical NTP hydrolase)
MTPNEYQVSALRTMADQRRVLARLADLGPAAMQLDNAARGLCNDAGEVAGAVMKFIEYGRPLDKVNLIEELGDCLWRIAQACDAIGVSVEHVMSANLRKLLVRYPDHYSDVLAADRDRDAERLALAAEPKWDDPNTPPGDRSGS